jgi:hypothetical protein
MPVVVQTSLTPALNLLERARVVERLARPDRRIKVDETHI